MNGRSLFTCLLICSVVAGAAWALQEQERVEPTATFMQQKPDAMRDILTGLTTENYEMITTSAQRLLLISQEADWNSVTTPEYLAASSDFRDTLTRLMEHGRDKNLDAAALVYFETTLSCIRCHKQLR